MMCYIIFGILEKRKRHTAWWQFVPEKCVLCFLRRRRDSPTYCAEVGRPQAGSDKDERCISLSGGNPPTTPKNSSKYLNSNPFLVIINLKNRNAAVYGCCRTHRPTQVHTHLHSGHPAAPHKYYTLFSSPSQGEKNKRYIFYVLH